MNDAQLGQIETELLEIYMPGISKAHRKALRKLCKEKGIKIFSPELQTCFRGLLESIIRHRETNYDEAVRIVGKERARFYTHYAVENTLNQIGM